MSSHRMRHFRIGCDGAVKLAVQAGGLRRRLDVACRPPCRGPAVPDSENAQVGGGSADSFRRCMRTVAYSHPMQFAALRTFPRNQPAQSPRRSPAGSPGLLGRPAVRSRRCACGCEDRGEPRGGSRHRTLWPGGDVSFRLITLVVGSMSLLESPRCNQLGLPCRYLRWEATGRPAGRALGRLPVRGGVHQEVLDVDLNAPHRVATAGRGLI
jgi:hypothetical protein